MFHVLLLPFIVLLQNKHTTFAKISTQPRISFHSQGQAVNQINIPISSKK